MTATEFEFLGELEDEFEEEVTELEPLFSRGKPTPVSGPAPKAVDLRDLQDEFEDEALELEPLLQRRTTFEFEGPTPARRPAANAVDSDTPLGELSGSIDLTT